MNKYTERIYNGIVKENPIFILMLGMCPTLAVTTSAINGLGMGLSTTVVLIMSNLIIAALRNIIPDRVRIPAFIVIVASLVTVVQLLIQAYIPFLYDALGIYIPLIVVNCIILGRAESYASRNSAVLSAFDGIGMGIGFSVALTAIGAVRELFGSGSVFGKSNISYVSIVLIAAGILIAIFLKSAKLKLAGGIIIAVGFAVNLLEFARTMGSVVIPDDYHISIFVLAPGAFFVLAILTALQNKFRAPSATNGSVQSSRLACGGDCVNCSGSSCMSNHDILETRKRQALEEALQEKKANVTKAQAELDAATAKKD